MFVRQIKEEVGHLISRLLTEDKATDNRSKGRKLAKSYVNFDRPGGEQEMEVWKKLPVVRKDDYALAPYLYPLYFRDKPNDEQCGQINSFLLNSDLSVDELKSKYDSLTKLMELVGSGEKSEEKEETKNTTDSEYKYNGYKIVRINDFNDAKKYAHYVDWCITQSPSHFKSYTKDFKLFYFCLERGFENVEPDAYEYDESMLAVLVDKYGMIYDVVSRSNNEEYADEDELFQILGSKAKDVIVPISKEELKGYYDSIINKMLEFAKCGNYEEVDELCDYSRRHYEGLYHFYFEQDFCGFIDTDKAEIIEELNGYTGVTHFEDNNSTHILVRKDNKYNIIDIAKKSLVFDEDKYKIKKLGGGFFSVKDDSEDCYIYDPSNGERITEYGLTNVSDLKFKHVVMSLSNGDRLLYSLTKKEIVYNLNDKNLRGTYVDKIIGVGDLDYFDLETDREFTLKNGVGGYEVEKIEREYTDYLGTNMCLCLTTDKKRIFVNDKVEIVGRPFTQVISFKVIGKGPLVTDGKEDFYIIE